MKIWLGILLSWVVCLGFVRAQNAGAFSISSVTKSYFPEDSVQLYRTSYQVMLTGSGRIRKINSIRVENWTLSFDKLEKKIRMKPGQPLQLVVNCMENRRAKRTEWMLTSWYGSNESATNLYVIESERMKNGHTGLPDVELICSVKKQEIKLTAYFPGTTTQ